MLNKEGRCIYCNKGTKDGVKISESHIIPDAIINKKISYKNGCAIEHNSVFGNTFECEVIEKMKWITNFLGIYKDGKIQPYKSNFKINGRRFNKKFSQTNER